ncbi:hypothetical protein C8J57DRAFT_1533800 [Mycena rebaudengoi]|nr:hypothetical protein C8J57DRAFT_1533800 [Mycena rebaudengoi]
MPLRVVWYKMFLARSGSYGHQVVMGCLDLLICKIKKELMDLTGINKSLNTDSDSDSDASNNPPSPPTMSFEFSANVDSPTDLKVLIHAADLIWKEQHDPKAPTFSLPHKDLPFTHSDLLEFGKTGYRSWKKNWKVENDPEVAAKHARQAAKDRQAMRRKDLKKTRLKAVKEYRKVHKKDPVCILETDWVSDEISALDTEDKAKKCTHREKLVREARLGPSQHNSAIWEILRPEYQSAECTETKDELDGICRKQKQALKKTPRPSVPHGNKELMDAFLVYEKNPDGFGDDGYTGDNEGT